MIKPHSIKKKKENLNYQFSNFSLSELVFKNKSEISKFKRNFSLSENISDLGLNIKQHISQNLELDPKEKPVILLNKRKNTKGESSKSDNNSYSEKTFRSSNKVFLTATEKSKFLDIYRKGIDQNTKTNLTRDSSKRQIVKIMNKKRAVKNFITREDDNQEKFSPSSILEIDYKIMDDLRKTEKKQNIDALYVEIANKCSEKFQLNDSSKFSKEFRICQDMIDIDKDEEMLKFLDELVSKNKLTYEMNKEIEKIVIDKKQGKYN